MDEIDAGHELEQLAATCWGTADAARGHVDLAWIGLGVGDEFGNGFRRRTDGSLALTKRRPVDAGDRRDVAKEIEAQLVVKRMVDGVLRVLISRMV